MGAQTYGQDGRMSRRLTCLVAFAVTATGCNGGTPEGVVKKYLATAKWQDRLAYVARADDVKNKMKEHYGDTYKGPTKFTSMDAANCDAVRCSINVWLSDEDLVIYALEKTPSGWKIDWESSIGYNPVTPAAFKAQRPTTPTRFCAWASLSDYYNYEFSDGQKSWYSIRLLASDDEELPTGYVDRKSPVAAEIFEGLKDGKPHQVIADLSFPPDSTGNVVYMRPVKVGSWRVPDGETTTATATPPTPTTSATTPAHPVDELPPDGQVLRDTMREVVRLARMGCNVTMKDPVVISKKMDPYEKDTCTAVVRTRCGDWSFNVGAHYKREGTFWRLKGVSN